MVDTSHLRGLIRLSPCCHAVMAHVDPHDHPDGFKLTCTGCSRVIEGDHELWNYRGDQVWPVDPYGPFQPPTPRPRIRRKPTEPDPPTYRLLLPTKR